jgi:metal-responsive CopG/Arc/MetJ family transcriptional regulator
MSRNVLRNRFGRPRLGKAAAPVVPIRFPDESLKKVDAWAKRNKLKSRSEAVRKLVEMGLSARKSGEA